MTWHGQFRWQADAADGAGAGDEECLVPPARGAATGGGGGRSRNPAALAALAALVASAALCAGVLARGRRASQEPRGAGGGPAGAAPRVPTAAAADGAAGSDYPRGALPRALPQGAGGNLSDDEGNLSAARGGTPATAAAAYSADGLEELPILTNGDFSTGNDSVHNCVSLDINGSILFDLGEVCDVASVSIAGGNAELGGIETPKTIELYKANGLDGSWAIDDAQTIHYPNITDVDDVANAQRKDWQLEKTMRARFVKLRFPDSQGCDFQVVVRQVAFACAETTATGPPANTTATATATTTVTATVTTSPTTKAATTSTTAVDAATAESAALVTAVYATATSTETTTVEITTAAAAYAAGKPGRGSLYCFALMIPDSYEEELLLWQVSEGVSLFACEEAAVYSNISRLLAPAAGRRGRSLTTLRVDANLSCEVGGEFGTALNTEIFFAVWDAVIANGRYKAHDWSVKVDPDCVFFPHRMRGTLDPLVDDGRNKGGVYINNCQFGLHGPLEVLSVAAVDQWDGGRQECVDHFEALCEGPCLWGEDMFLDQCLQFLNSTRVDDFDQLLEDHCDPPDGWQECANGSTAAFHPYKNKSAYEKCFHSAYLAGGHDHEDAPLNAVRVVGGAGVSVVRN